MKPSHLLWAILIENGGEMAWDEAVAKVEHGGQRLGPWKRDEFVERVGSQVRFTERGWRHVRYAYTYAVEHGYDNGK